MNISASVPSKQRPVEATASAKKWHIGTLTYTTAGIVALFCWLLWGDFAWQMRERSVGPIIQLLFKKFEASDAVTGLVLGTLPGILALLIGPVISFKSDRCRSRWGRRIPFLLWTTPLVVAAMVGLAFSPAIGTYFHVSTGVQVLSRNQIILITLALFWTLFEFGSLIVNSTFGALVNDVVPHNFLGRFYGLFRALSLIAGIIFNYWMLAWAEVHYFWIFIGLGILYGFGFWLMCSKVKEGEYPPPEPEAPRQTWLDTVIVYIKECYGDSYYLWFFAFGTLSMAAITPINSFSLYFAKSINMDLGYYGKCIAISYTFSFCMAYPIGMLVDRFHALRVGLVALAFYTVVTLLGGLYARDAFTFAVAFVAHCILAGTYGTATAAIAQMMLPKDRFAQFCSAWGIIGCFVGMPIAPLTGVFLDYSQHQYRYTFLISSGLSLISLVLGIVVYLKAKARNAL